MRAIYEIAREVSADWRDVNYAAKPYLLAMHSLQDMTDSYGLDPASDVVARFLCNAGTWRGEVARRVKKELNDGLKAVRR